MPLAPFLSLVRDGRFAEDGTDMTFIVVMPASYRADIGLQELNRHLKRA